MNVNTVSAECAHNCCSQCTFEDCACVCHLAELLRSKTAEIQEAGFFRDRAWYEENDPQSLVDSINGNFDPLACSSLTGAIVFDAGGEQ